MTSIGTLISGIAISALLCGAAGAQGLDAGASVETGAAARPGGGAGAGAGAAVAAQADAARGGEATARATAPRPRAEDPGAGLDGVAGRTLVTSDGKTIGVVDHVDTSAGGTARLIVRLSGDLGVAVNSVSLASDLATAVDGSSALTLGMSRADFVAAIEAGVKAQAKTRTY